MKKRLATIAKARSFIEWPKIKQLAADLELQRRTIVEQVAIIHPAEALALMWQFLALANAVLSRCDDSSGAVSGVFRGSVQDLAGLASEVKPVPEVLAGTVYGALLENDYGQYDHLIEALADTLGPEGLKQLKAKFVELANTPVEKPPIRSSVGAAIPVTSMKVICRSAGVSLRLSTRSKTLPMR